jgi:hypothetical protein
MKFIRFLACGLLCLTALTVAAQWQWIDADGRRVFSDRVPPADVPEKNIVKRPGGNRGAAISYPSATPVAAEAAPAPAATSGVDKALQEKRKKAEDEQAAKRKVEDDRAAQARAENCGRAQQAKVGLDSGQRIARTNDKGEREFMDDSARAAEAERLQGIISENCR